MYKLRYVICIVPDRFRCSKLVLIASFIVLLFTSFTLWAQQPQYDDATMTARTVAEALKSDHDIKWMASGDNSVMAVILRPFTPCGTVTRLAPKQFGFNTGLEYDRTIHLFPHWQPAIEEARSYCLSLAAQRAADQQAAAEIEEWQAKKARNAHFASLHATYGPVLLFAPDVDMPDSGRRLKVQGNVTVNVTVNIQGLPEDPVIAKNELHGADDSAVPLSIVSNFDESALRSARRYRFKPAVKDGVPVETQIALELNFQIF